MQHFIFLSSILSIASYSTQFSKQLISLIFVLISVVICGVISLAIAFAAMAFKGTIIQVNMAIFQMLIHAQSLKEEFTGPIECCGI